MVFVFSCFCIFLYQRLTGLWLTAGMFSCKEKKKKKALPEHTGKARNKCHFKDCVHFPPFSWAAVTARTLSPQTLTGASATPRREARLQSHHWSLAVAMTRGHPGESEVTEDHRAGNTAASLPGRLNSWERWAPDVMCNSEIWKDGGVTRSRPGEGPHRSAHLGWDRDP